MREITINLYELDEYNFIDSSIFSAIDEEAITYFDITINSSYLYASFLLKYGDYNICYDLPNKWLRVLNNKIILELAILKFKLNNITYDYNDALTAEDSTLSKQFEKQPISLNITTNENEDYLNSANKIVNERQITTIYDAKMQVLDSIENIIEEFLDKFKDLFLGVF